MISTSLNYSQINSVLLGTAFFLLVPFLITDLYFVYTSSSPCIYAYIPNPATNPFQALQVGQWLKCDGFIKLAILVIGLYFNMVRIQSGYDRMMTLCLANIMRAFWIFNLGWCIAGGVLFWGSDYNFNDRAFCADQLNNYLWAVLICNYMISVFGFITCLLRPPAQTTVIKVNMLPNQQPNNIYA